jgi:hypothetical protein
MTQQRMVHALLRTTPAAYNRRLLQSHFQGKQLPAGKVLNSDATAVRFVLTVPDSVTIVDGIAATSTPLGVTVLRTAGKLPEETGCLLP